MWAEILQFIVIGFITAIVTIDGWAAEDHSHHKMQVDLNGAVMNENTDQLPRSCTQISEDVQLTVSAGQKYVKAAGNVYALSPRAISVPPCSRVSVTFKNEDDVRHQWMIHGLPKYLYPAGMFHIEAMGGTTQIGTFIVPAQNQTYLLHCDIAQHMEKGMRGQLIVGTGSGNLWGVVGVSDAFYRSSYWPTSAIIWLTPFVGLATLMGIRLSGWCR